MGPPLSLLPRPPPDRDWRRRVSSDRERWEPRLPRATPGTGHALRAPGLLPQRPRLSQAHRVQLPVAGARRMRTTTPGRLHNTRPAISVSKDVARRGWDFPASFGPEAQAVIPVLNARGLGGACPLF